MCDKLHIVAAANGAAVLQLLKPQLMINVSPLMLSAALCEIAFVAALWFKICVTAQVCYNHDVLFTPTGIQTVEVQQEAETKQSTRRVQDASKSMPDFHSDLFFDKSDLTKVKRAFILSLMHLGVFRLKPQITASRLHTASLFSWLPVS